jgi:hypothetical protein
MYKLMQAINRGNLKMNKTRVFHLILTALMAMSVCGCSDKSFFEKNANDGVVQAQENRESKPHHGKPGASVRLVHSQPFYLESPGVADLDLLLSAAASAGNMQVDISVGQGLELLSAQSRFDFVLANGGIYKLPLQISAAGEGRFYINLHVRITNDQQHETKVIAAMIQVGALAARTFKKQDDDLNDDEPAVMDLPAQETVRPSQ